MSMTKKQKRITAASTAAALLLAGGVAVYEVYDTSTPTTQGVTAIDWSLYDLNVPTINVPTIDVPTVNVPQIATVVIKLDSPSTGLTSTSLNIPSTDGNTTITLPVISSNSSVDTTLANTSGSISTATTVTMPIIDTTTSVDTTLANTSGFILNKTSLVELNKNIGSITNTLAKMKLDDPSKDLPEWIAFIEESKKVFADQRSIEHDRTFTKTNPIIQQWMDIYKQYKNVEPVKYVAITKPFKMITEVRPPKDSKQLKILDENLTYYKSEGYDSVLVAFDKDNSVYEVLNTIKYIRSYHKIDVWLTYTGKESLYETAFMDVSKYTDMLTTCAPYVHGYVNSWRKTSAHLLEQDAQFMNYTNHTLRRANPVIPIIGELYFGNTHKYDSVGNIGFGINNFENSSGVMIVNFGFMLIDMKYLFGTVLKPYLGDIPKIGWVVGDKPYYMTTYNNGLDYKENMKMKHYVEKQFMKHGCIGTVTLADDGRHVNANNLSETLYYNLQGPLKK